MPTLSPAWPWSSSLRNISTPVQVVFCVGLDADDFDFFADLDDAALHTAGHRRCRGRRWLKTSSTGIRKAPSTARSGVGMSASSASARRKMACSPRVALVAFHARLGRCRGRWGVVAGEVVLAEQFATSISTSSSSLGVVDHVALVQNTMMWGTPTWRASRMCSRVCGIGPSAAEHHQDRAVHLRRARDHVLHVVGVRGSRRARSAGWPSRTRRARC